MFANLDELKMQCVLHGVLVDLAVAAWPSSPTFQSEVARLAVTQRPYLEAFEVAFLS